jgi:hypothetical protein
MDICIIASREYKETHLYHKTKKTAGQDLQFSNSDSLLPLTKNLIYLIENGYYFSTPKARSHKFS